jgi:hypothetical protein
MEIEQGDLLKYLERLSGTWVGEGAGEYPTISPFSYREVLTFEAAESKAYWHFDQRTWLKDENGKETQSHWESGFWRFLQNNEIELLCTQSSGRVEIARGWFSPIEEGFRIEFQSNRFTNNVRVEQSWREYDLRGDILRNSLKMQTTEVPALAMHVQSHLKCIGSQV